MSSQIDQRHSEKSDGLDEVPPFDDNIGAPELITKYNVSATNQPRKPPLDGVHQSRRFKP